MGVQNTAPNSQRKRQSATQSVHRNAPSVRLNEPNARQSAQSVRHAKKAKRKTRKCSTWNNERTTGGGYLPAVFCLTIKIFRYAKNY